MSRDYKNVRTAASTAARSGSPMWVGILIGLLVGLCIALGVALYINKGANPFMQKKAAEKPAEKSSETQKESNSQEPSRPAAAGEKHGKSGDAKPRFDFYKILPGTEEAVTDKEFKRASPAAPKEVYFLQVAAFQNPSDADNLKARLALAGIEAQIQTATLPDGQVWHRVRVGPFSSQEDLARSRASLKENKLEANLIKVRE
ncbi:MAG TPA: SPOR domain-containing protein [Burkholderiales bacterium]|nr:SPOR domain-containing protein [Burkholderiales bacterium]